MQTPHVMSVSPVQHTGTPQVPLYYLILTPHVKSPVHSTHAVQTPTNTSFRHHTGHTSSCLVVLFVWAFTITIIIVIFTTTTATRPIIVIIIIFNIIIIINALLLLLLSSSPSSTGSAPFCPPSKFLLAEFSGWYCRQLEQQAKLMPWLSCPSLLYCFFFLTVLLLLSCFW